MTFGLLVGNRGFFPAHLVTSGREQMIAILEGHGHRVICPTPEQTKYGAVESRADAKACAGLFSRHSAEIEGIIVTLPNFGDEKAAAETIRLAGLNVPVLVHAFPDTPGKMLITDRRDSFCGKMSVCNNLQQFGIRYSLTSLHTVDPASTEFTADVSRFAALCRVVNGLRRLRIGAIGARPSAFNTVRYSEKLLEANGISIEPIDLSEIFGRINRLTDTDKPVKAKLDAIHAYVQTASVPGDSLVKMAKLGAVIDEWMQAHDLAISAVQCWTSMEEYFGVVPCTVMSMMSNNLMSAACEVDIAGVVGMHALRLASGTPSALLDWNNNYGENPDKAVCFHCSNLPKHFFADVRMDFQEIIAGTVGKMNTFGTMVGKVKASPMTFARFSTHDVEGRMRGYLGEGRFTDDSLNTFGGAGVVEIEGLQDLLHYICENGFEHHIAANMSTCAAAVYEATGKYLGWDIHWHGASGNLNGHSSRR
jgi:L-fucose isomerase-like protein